MGGTSKCLIFEVLHLKHANDIAYSPDEYESLSCLGGVVRSPESHLNAFFTFLSIS